MGLYPVTPLPDRLTAGRLVLVQLIGVRIPVREPTQYRTATCGIVLVPTGEDSERLKIARWQFYV